MSAKAGQQAPVVSGSQVMSAGIASAGAAIVTSKFGVAGTILGAALTTMIITGGAALLKAYLESMTGNVRKVPRRLWAKRERRKAARYAEPETLPDRPDLRDNFMGRMRAAVGWFSRLPVPARRSILVKGLIAAAIAFVISMGAIYVLERGIGNSLSCGLWGACPEGRTPGIHLGGGDGTGAAPTIRLGSGGQAATNTGGGVLERQSPVQQGDSGYEPPVQQRDPAAPADSGRPLQPAQPQNPAVTPDQEAPVPGAQPPADGAEVPAPGAAPSEAQPPAETR